MNAFEALSVVMMLVVLLSLAVLCVEAFQATKKVRAKDGESVLRTARRFAAALVVCCVCYAAGRALFNYGAQDEPSMLWCLVNGAKDGLILAVGGALAYYMFRKKGLALKEENQSDLGE